MKMQVNRWSSRVAAERDEVDASRSHRNQYSIERLGALHAYTESHRTLHAVAICVGALVVPLLVILALDALPLQRPEAGWDKNVSFWCRTCAMTIIAANEMLLQLQVMAPVADLAGHKIVLIALAVAPCYTASLVLLAKLWDFPIPFFTMLSVPIWFILLLAALGYTIGVDNPGRTRFSRRK